MRKNNDYSNQGLSPNELAEYANRTPQAIYFHARKLGELPTKEYLDNLKPGRPGKFAVTDLTLKELCESTGYSRQGVINIAKDLGRLPSLEELKNHKANTRSGRKRKYN